MEISLDHKTNALETRRVRLREIHDEDLNVIFQWRNTEKFRFLLHYNTEMISYEEFCEEFSTDSASHKYQYLIEKKEGRVPVGFAYVDTFSEQYRSCFINLFIAQPFEKKGYGVDAFVLFTLFLFQRVGLKKLFAHAFDFNDHSLSCIRNIGMRELVGNITKVPERGNVLCFAADESIVPNLARINNILSTHKSSFFNY
jgi:RimJ/RimL family protein N-acetyltransferase